MALLLVVAVTLLVLDWTGVVSISIFQLAAAIVVVRIVSWRLNQQSRGAIGLGLNDPIRRQESTTTTVSEDSAKVDAPHPIPPRPAIDQRDLRLPILSQRDFGPIRQELQRELGDGYVVGDVLGRGGFGVVVAAKDVALSRELAIKLVGRHDNDDALIRFRREATILANLRHPHIVPV